MAELRWNWPQELAAPAALQQVALDLGEAAARAAGVATLARLLWAASEDGAPAQRFPGLSFDRAGLLAAARPHLTAAEQVWPGGC